LFELSSQETWTHVRLNIYPDGGVARFHVHGEVKPIWNEVKRVEGLIDLAAVENGGSILTCDDMFFGSKENLILPGRAKNMGDGWETQRKRGPGHDWIVVRLGTRGKIKKIEVDTNHFKGNFPESCSIEGCRVADRNLKPSDCQEGSALNWQEILPRTKLQADHRHFFERELNAVSLNNSFDYIRLNIFPDGGVSRLRVFGEMNASE